MGTSCPATRTKYGLAVTGTWQHNQRKPCIQSEYKASHEWLSRAQLNYLVPISSYPTDYILYVAEAT